MKTQWKRLAFAATISSSVFVGTWMWYQSTDNSIASNNTEKPLAYVGKVMNDIQRRPSSRLLWQIVNTGEPLYNGEAIRTSEQGEVRIQFADSDRYLDLEPESLIVIKKSEGEIALDLMEGSLFVNAKEGGNADPSAPGLVLNSANGKVDLSQASASLTKGKGNAVDVQVLEGKASIKTEDGKSKDLTSNSVIKILSPSLQKPLAMDSESLQPIPFKWVGFPDTASVALWVGPTRKDLKLIQTAQPKETQISASLPFGRHFWKLVATDPTGKVIQESSVYKTELLARYAPTVVFPTADAQVPAEKSPFDMTFKWQKGDDTRQMTLEVWSDAGLQKRIATKSFKDEDTFTLPALKSGTYYWRMSSYYVDSLKPVLGKIQKFTVTEPEQVQVAIEAPKAAPIVPVNVSFNMPESSFTQQYIDTPQVGLSWKADKSEDVASWRVKLYSAEEDASQAKPFEVKETQFKTTVSKPGRYIASIEAVNKDGQVLGTTPPQTLDISPLPLLKAPQFLPAEGQLQASMDGKHKLEWSQVDGAKEYWLVISKNGKELKRSKYATNSTSLKNLLPGEYDVEISAVDSHGRESETANPRKLLVPDKSNLKAPTLKKLR